jgi:DNA-binding transcriptional LysR family regulator
MLTLFDLNLRHLAVVVAIEAHDGIGAASVAANLSQPALTQALAKLEGMLGQQLFDRQPRGARTTRAGRLFLARAKVALDYIVEGGQQARRAARAGAMPHIERIVTMAQLRALDSVERHASYTRAGRVLGISQPSVHKAIRELELQIGTPLLVREEGGIRATPAGTRLVRAIRLAASELQAGFDELAALTEFGAGRITVGSLPLPKASLLPRSLARFSADHQRAIIGVVEGAYDELLAALREGAIDLLVGGLRDPPPAADVRQRPLFAYSLSVVARAGHPLAGIDHPSPHDLAAFPWVTSAPGAPMRGQWEALFAGTELPRQCIMTSSVLTVRELLLNGDWLALMSPDQFHVEAMAGLLTQVGPPLAGSERLIGITTRTAWRPTDAQASFIANLLEVSQERSDAPLKSSA